MAMAFKDYLCTEFNPQKRLHVAPRDIAKLVGLPTAFLGLIETPLRAQIAVKHESDGSYTETMDFEPDDPRSFWLKINIEKDDETIPLMGLKFSAVSKNRLEVSSPYLRVLTPGTDVYMRPTLRHEAIENVAGLIYAAAGITVKPYPVPDRSFRSDIVPLFL